MNDSLGMKYKLSEYGNNLLDQIWMTNIVIASQSLECSGELRVARFGLPSSKGYDGIHMRGKMAVQHYTASMINVLLDVFNGQEKKNINVQHRSNLTPPQSFADVLKKSPPTPQFKFVPSVAQPLPTQGNTQQRKNRDANFHGNRKAPKATKCQSGANRRCTFSRQ